MNLITSLFEKFERGELHAPRANPSFSFDEALKHLPRAVEGNYDPLTHKTVADLVWIAQHEYDMYSEGEETDVKNWKQAAALLAYIKKYGGAKPKPNPSFETEDDISLFLRALSATGNLKDFSEGHWIEFGRHEGMSNLEIIELIEQAAGWVQDTTDDGRKPPERAAWARGSR